MRGMWWRSDGGGLIAERYVEDSGFASFSQGVNIIECGRIGDSVHYSSGCKSFKAS